MLAESPDMRLLEAKAPSGLNAYQLFRTLGKDWRRSSELRGLLKDAVTKRQLAKHLAPMADKIGLSATGTAAERDALQTTMNTIKRELETISSRHKQRAAWGLAGTLGTGFAYKTYKHTKKKAAMNPQYRQFDVYPQHNYATAGATQYRRPFYDTAEGGRERPGHIPIRPSSGRLGAGEVHYIESLIERGAAIQESKAPRASKLTQIAASPFRLPSEQEIAQMEAVIEKDPKALKMYKIYRRKYAVNKALLSAFWAGLLLPFFMRPSAMMAGLMAFSGYAGGKSTFSQSWPAEKAHAIATKKSFQSMQTQKKFNRLLEK